MDKPYSENTPLPVNPKAFYPKPKAQLLRALKFENGVHLLVWISVSHKCPRPIPSNSLFLPYKLSLHKNPKAYISLVSFSHVAL